MSLSYLCRSTFLLQSRSKIVYISKLSRNYINLSCFHSRYFCSSSPKYESKDLDDEFEIGGGFQMLSDNDDFDEVHIY